VLIILRYVNEIRDAQPYFESLTVADEGEAVSLAVNLIKSLSGPFQPKTMPDKYAEAVEELVKAKIEQRAPEIEMVRDGESPKVLNIMAALKKSMEKKGRAGVREAVRKRSGKSEGVEQAHQKGPRRSGSISKGR
jgi:DNA end-binding protein Ku